MTVIGVVAAAVGGVEQLREGLVQPLIQRGHQVAVTLTPTAASWFDPHELSDLEKLTGLPVRSHPRMPGQERPHPPIDVFVGAPLSASSVAKLALGIGDNQALTVLSEALGTTPVVVFPRVNAAHVRHPAWAGHLNTLRAAGAALIEWHPLEPRVESGGRELPWREILDAVERIR
ncbi:flavoprotein [Kribbella orskensis]|uniref:Flavoprotein n=1 Tax=Kribbella orskensis TaxID=2512216 RepID=A0ABY2BD18_9ACTN|nr:MULTISPECIES: flavoprotein [Kribbella]TCN35349.1 flavoprotein [Kribbella sp. VKM Ac-2500]TCO16770.1 flavoprotein [Kribbella orskensis]